MLRTPFLCCFCNSLLGFLRFLLHRVLRLDGRAADHLPRLCTTTAQNVHQQGSCRWNLSQMHPQTELACIAKFTGIILRMQLTHAYIMNMILFCVEFTNLAHGCTDVIFSEQRRTFFGAFLPRTILHTGHQVHRGKPFRKQAPLYFRHCLSALRACIECTDLANQQIFSLARH